MFDRGHESVSHNSCRDVIQDANGTFLFFSDSLKFNQKLLKVCVTRFTIVRINHDVSSVCGVYSAFCLIYVPCPIKASTTYLFLNKTCICWKQDSYDGVPLFQPQKALPAGVSTEVITTLTF